MTILFAILAAVAVVAFGIVLKMLLNEQGYHDKSISALNHVRDKYDKACDENLKLRQTNRVANKYDRAQQARLRAELREGRAFAKTLEQFHRQIESEMAHELGNAYAMVELLMDRVPKEAPIKINCHEAKRLFIR